MLLSKENQAVLLKLSREALKNLRSKNFAQVLERFERSPEGQRPELKAVLPCFVTLLTKSGRLRGCIGTMAAVDPLYKGVFDYTERAAMEDPRFRPVEPGEVGDLAIEISVLGPMTKVEDWSKIEIGRHGLLVTDGSRRGVLLAKVATEYGWDVEQFAQETCVKAGLNPEKWKDYTYHSFEEFDFSEEAVIARSGATKQS